MPGPTHSVEWGRGVSGGAMPETHDLGGAASKKKRTSAGPDTHDLGRARHTWPRRGLLLARPSQRHSGDVPFRPFPAAPLPRRPDPSAMPNRAAARRRREPRPQAAEPDSTSWLEAGVGGLQGDGSYPHVGPDGDDGAVSNEAPPQPARRMGHPGRRVLRGGDGRRCARHPSARWPAFSRGGGRRASDFGAVHHLR